MASLLHTHAAKFCVFCEFRVRTAHHSYLCKSVPSVGEKIFPQNAQNLLAEKILPQISTDAHRCRRVWHPCHTHAAQFCVFCVLCGRTAHPNHLCSSVPSVGEKIFPQNVHTEPSGREEPLTDEHGCSQIRRVWHPCHTHAAQFCVFCEFCGRTAHPNHLCQSVLSVGVLSLQEGSVCSVHSVGGVAVVWCSRDCCTPWWCIRAICGRFSQQSASVSSACSVGGQRSSNLL